MGASHLFSLLLYLLIGLYKRDYVSGWSMTIKIKQYE